MKNAKNILLFVGFLVFLLGGCKNPFFPAGDEVYDGDSQQLAAPENLQINDVVLTWDVVANASGYSVQIDNNPPVNNGKLTSFSLESLGYGTYSIKVKALGNGTTYTDSVWSEPKTYEFENQGLTPLEIPTNVKISGTDLTWDEVAGAVSYLVDITGMDYPTAANSYSLSGLTEPGIYAIRVKAIGDNESNRNSEWSESQEYIVSQQLVTPSNLQINGTSLTWNAVDNASGYTVDIDGAEYLVDTVSFSLSVLSDYKTYTIKVKAKGNGTTYTDSGWSDTTGYELLEPDLPALDTPVNVQINGTELTWDTVSDAIRYSVEIDGAEHEADANNYSLSVLTVPGIYTIKVKAIGDNVSNKNSEWSEPQEYTVSQQLAAPSNLQTDNATLTWTAVDNAIGYLVDIDGVEHEATENSHSLSGLTSLGIYTIKIKAIGNGITYTDSEWSEPQEYIVSQPLAVPSNLQTDGATLTWTAVDNASGYLVDIDGVEYPADTASFSLSVLSDYKTYAIKVKAMGNGTTYADSGWSDPTSYTLQAPVVPALDTPVNVQINGTTVTWNTVSGAVRYSVEIDGVEHEASVNSYSLSDLTVLGIYTIKVKAIGDNVTHKNSEWSESVQYTFSQQLAAPSNLSINGATLTWTAVDNASGYLVDIDGTEHEAATNSHSLSSLTAPKIYTIKVKAVGNGTTYTDSAWSGTSGYTVSQQLAVPSNLQTTGSTLKWTAVSNASSYLVDVDGMEHTADTNSYSLLSSTTPATYTVKVKTIGNGTVFLNSEWSGTIDYTIKEPTLGLAFTLINGDTAYSVSKGTVTAAEVVIPPVYNGLPVTAIASRGFREYTTMASVSIPDSVTNIGVEAFSNCSGLTSVTIPDSVTSIGNSAFSYCSGLTSVTIPDSVTSIGNFAFRNCTGLTSVNIPDSVTVIAAGVFDSCSGLTSVTIPNGVTSIGPEAFYGCSGLTSVTIPNSVTSIGEGAFCRCSGLASVTIGNSVTSIASIVFSYCSSLTSITIPNSVTSIGVNAFSRCSDLTNITVENGNTVYRSEGNCIIQRNSDTLILGCKNSIIPNNVSRIDSNAFLGCSGLTSVTIPESVTVIAAGVFDSCSGLTSVTIPNSVTSIGSSAFSGCSGLTSVTFVTGSNISSFGNNAFPQGTNGSGGNSLQTAYSTGGAGTYTREVNGTVWAKQ